MPKKLPDMSDRCRMCLVNHGCMTSLQDERVKSKLQDLTKCTSIDIKCEENLPGVVCHVCLYKLDMWDKFKEQFIQSNKILMGQLKASEVPDNTIKDLSKGESLATESTKRKRLNESGQDSVSDNDKKKSKMEIPSSELASADCTMDQPVESKTISDNGEAVLSKDSSAKVLNDSNSNKHKDEENGNGEYPDNNLSSGLQRARLLPGRRGRAIERRKASTRRWVERKKALLAATRDDVSDSDSITSDDAQLSPVQKARAKTNADKEMERQKRIAKVLKNLEINFTEKYSIIHHGNIDTDSDTRRTKLNRELKSNSKENKKDLPQKVHTEKQSGVKRNKSSSQANSIAKKNSPLTTETNNITDNGKKNESQAKDEIFIPHSMKAELVIGDTTYIVTSILTGSQVDKDSLNNLTKDCNVDESSQEKNTDIIDAVQLRRIRPTASSSNSKKSVERCLNIEVEGTELDALKHVQIGLSDFVENEMKNKLFGINCNAKKKSNTYAKHYQKLDQQLKTMVEKAIKNNIESTLMRDAADISAKINNQQSTRLSPALVKVAENSPKYQPKVVLKRLDLVKLNKLYNIDIKTLRQFVPKNKLAGPFSAISRKRQSVLPIRYNDYNTSALDSNSDVSDDINVQETPRAMNAPNIRTYRNLKQSSGTNSQITIIKRMDSTISKSTVDNVNLSSFSIEENSMVAVSVNEEKPDYEDVIKIEGAIAENHICGVCGLTFNSRKDVEAHVRTHKVVDIENNATAPRQTQKQKMMRCRRCQEIVEARYVKAHMCKNIVHTHKCYVCNSMFQTEKLLIRHLDSHDQSEFNIEKITKIDTKKQNNNDISKAAASILIVSTKPEEEQKIDAPNDTQNVLTEENVVQSDKITNLGGQLNSTNAMEKPKETYTCFVCDKTFTDEEILKDHLQKHCDDLSEGEQNNSKEQYQCAICGDTLESDQALEEHVGKHLFDDEDDNPNLISIGDQEKPISEKPKSKTYYCDQCPEMFDSDVLLEMHIQAHEEEAAIAEWEKKGTNVSPYQCMLCEQSEFIDTEEELAVHLDVIHNIHKGDTEICQLCDRSFRTLEDLQEHVATH